MNIHLYKNTNYVVELYQNIDQNNLYKQHFI
jgi:hypothetical protein